MKSFVPLSLLIAGIICAGCASHKADFTAAPGPSKGIAATPPTIVTPDNSITARVVSYNAVGRFVVLSFPVGQMPKTDQTLFLYRAGLKVGEIKITGPQRDNNTVADLINGEAQNGDEARDQ